jgi:intermediate peptidase
MAVFEALIEKRDELALMMGFSSFSELSLRNNRMARDPTTVIHFLNQLSAQIMPQTFEEVKILQEFKLKQEGTTELEGWDKAYYIAAAKSQLARDSKSKVQLPSSEEIAEYFTLGNCIAGIQILLERLFGLTVKINWPVNFPSDPIELAQRHHDVGLQHHQIWHQNVVQLLLSDPQEGFFGVLYLDLFHRPHKFSQSATFSIRFPKATVNQVLCEPGSAAIVCDFGVRTSKTRNSFASPSNTSSILEYVLFHSEVETLYHELGHALHCLLSRTHTQHLAGTRAALDFVEFPSTLFENYAWNFEFLQLWARDGLGRPLSQQWVHNLRHQRSTFAAIETQTQIATSMFDQLIHRADGRPLAALLHSQSSLLLDSLMHTHTLLPFYPHTRWQTTFGHVIGYAAGYYGYLYSRVFSTNIWHHCFLKDPLNREQGERLRRFLLQHGGTKDPYQMISNMLDGKDISTQIFVNTLSPLPK